MTELNPYLSFNGNAKEAITFYAAALGGKIEAEYPFSNNPEMAEKLPKEWQSKLMHGKVVIGNYAIMVSDVMIGDQPGQVKELNYKASPVTLSLSFGNEEEQTNAFNKMSEGANIDMPLQDTFWGARFGMLTDKFGIKWMFNYDKR